jgi:hypothetical protein
MLSSYWLFTPFILQMLCMAADEFGFHRSRGLPRWERIGHPLDTLTVLVCLTWVLCVPPDPWSVAVFAGLAVFSSLFVTKDEPIHHIHCPAAEQWLHSLLFTLHPIVLVSAALLWPAAHGLSPIPERWVEFHGFERDFLAGTFGLTLLFGIYQFVYWNLIWRQTNAVR